MLTKRHDERAWFLVLPMFLAMLIIGVIPLMAVVNYAFQDILSPDQKVFVGWEWFRSVLRDPELHSAFGRQLSFSAAVLLIEVPLGIALARLLPIEGPKATASLILLAMPLLIPHNVVGTIWQILGRADIGLFGYALTAAGIPYNYATNARDAWLTVLVMDIWHWLPLVVLLAYSGLRAIPKSFYQAAAIDGASRWKTFRFVELPRLKKLLVIAVLLRFMDSFMIYTEPFVLTGGGPGNATTFLSQFLTRLAIGQFDQGPAAAFSLIYFLITLLLSFVFYQAVMKES